MVITTCIYDIDSYRCLISQDLHTKNFGIRGFPGGGKTCCMMYCILYDIQKWLKITSMAMMFKPALKLGGIYSHQLFNIPTKYNLTHCRRAEISTLNLIKTPLPKSIYYVILICQPFMKWVNPQQNISLRLTLSIKKYVIVVYICGWCADYIFCGSYSYSDNWGSYISGIMSQYTLLQNDLAWKFCTSFQCWYIQTYP